MSHCSFACRLTSQGMSIRAVSGVVDSSEGARNCLNSLPAEISIRPGSDELFRLCRLQGMDRPCGDERLSVKPPRLA